MKTINIFSILLLTIFISCNNSDNPNSEYTVYQGATLFDGTGKKIENSTFYKIVLEKNQLIARHH